MNVFTKHFLSQGHNLRVYDINCSKAQSLAKKNNCAWFDSLPRAILDVDMVLLCTPIKDTPKLILDITPHMKNGSILCEIASLKMRTTSTLKVSKEHGVTPISAHPMFGPDIKKIENQTIVVVPVLNQHEEVALARTLFPDTKIVVIDAETHDRCMASVLSLPYFMNIAFAQALPHEKMTLLRELAGTTFTIQFAMTQSILGESSELIESLINENIFSGELLNRFIDESRHLRRLLRNDPHDFRNICENLSGSMMNESDFSSARELRNKSFEIIKTHICSKDDLNFLSQCS